MMECGSSSGFFSTHGWILCAPQTCACVSRVAHYFPLDHGGFILLLLSYRSGAGYLENNWFYNYCPRHFRKGISVFSSSLILFPPALLLEHVLTSLTMKSSAILSSQWPRESPTITSHNPPVLLCSKNNSSSRVHYLVDILTSCVRALSSRNLLDWFLSTVLYFQQASGKLRMKTIDCETSLTCPQNISFAFSTFLSSPSSN